MSNTKHLQKEHVKIIKTPKGALVEVVGGELYVDACVELARKSKQLDIQWDDVKLALRTVANEARMLAEADGEDVGTVHVLGSNEDYVQVAASRRRKELSNDVLSEFDEAFVQPLVVQTTEVVLTGDAATWAVQQLANLKFAKGEVTVKRATRLSADFENRRRAARQAQDPSVELLEKLGQAGCVAAAVEAKAKAKAE